MMVSLDIDTWIRLVAWLVVGMAIFFGFSRSHLRAARMAVLRKAQAGGDR
jgi:APA family basic amino acid/polyamine antiporter